jgi:uncharacterized repeat protein (TIGR01451 family)
LHPERCIAAAASYPAITLTVNVASNAPASVANTATVSGGGETNTSNDTANDTTTINPPPDLTITKKHSGNFTPGQTGASYSITVTNSGASATAGTVTVTDTLPASLTPTAISGSGWSCTLATLTCARSDALAAGASYPAITLTVNVSSNAPSSVTNTATVSGGGETNTANDIANDVTTINASNAPPDLTIAKSHTGNFIPGQAGATYTITVTNSGGGATSGAVAMTDTLPVGLTATDINGIGWNCDAPPSLSCTRSDALAAGTSYPAITLTVNVASNASASITNTATVSGGGEINTSNNTANDVTTVAGGLLSILTNRYDNLRTGANLGETTLKVANVNVNQFAKLYSYPVDGRAPTIDLAGNVYFSSGNATWDGVRNWGDSVLKLSVSHSGFSVLDWFTPSDWSNLNSGDLDLGSTGVTILPGTNILVAGGKASILSF